MSRYEQPLNPVEIEAALREVVDRIAKGIQVCSRTYREYLDADREYDRAFGHAYFAAEGAVKDRERRADLETMEQREARDVAEATYKHADRLAKALNEELRALQSLNASIRAAYSVAGRGET